MKQLAVKIITGRIEFISIMIEEAQGTQKSRRCMSFDNVDDREGIPGGGDSKVILKDS